MDFSFKQVVFYQALVREGFGKVLWGCAALLDLQKKL
jgi:hypothetical protein